LNRTKCGMSNALKWPADGAHYKPLIRELCYISQTIFQIPFSPKTFHHRHKNLRYKLKIFAKVFFEMVQSSKGHLALKIKSLLWLWLFNGCWVISREWALRAPHIGGATFMIGWRLSINSNLILPLKCHKKAIWFWLPMHIYTYLYIYLEGRWNLTLGIIFYDAHSATFSFASHFPFSTFPHTISQYGSQITGAHFHWLWS